MTLKVPKAHEDEGPMRVKRARYPCWKKMKSWPIPFKLRIIRRLIRRGRNREGGKTGVLTDLDQVCSICLVSVDPIASLSPNCCEHAFHFECIDGWSKEGDHRCPLCKRDYSMYTRFTLFGHQQEVEVGHRKKYDSYSSYYDESDRFDESNSLYGLESDSRFSSSDDMSRADDESDWVDESCTEEYEESKSDYISSTEWNPLPKPEDQKVEELAELFYNRFDLAESRFPPHQSLSFVPPSWYDIEPEGELIDDFSSEVSFGYTSSNRPYNRSEMNVNAAEFIPAGSRSPSDSDDTQPSLNFQTKLNINAPEFKPGNLD